MTSNVSTEAVERLTKRAHEIEAHVERVPGWYPEAIQHAADLSTLLAEHEAMRKALEEIDSYGVNHRSMFCVQIARQALGGSDHG